MKHPKLFLCASLIIALLSCSEKNAPINSNAENGALKGLFSVNTGTQVRFSQGNLQYRATASGTKDDPKWRFAERQYDIIGAYNSNISPNYEDWIDLFGYGTGNNPTNSSTKYSDYSNYVNWGANAISQSGAITDMWHTLSKDEWIYILRIRVNAEKLFGLGTINGINGMILLPDDWSTPKGVTFTPSTMVGLKEGYEYSYYNNQGNNFTHNTYTEKEWGIMEAEGAVFLPAAGHRFGTEVYSAGEIGYYWSSYCDANNGYCLQFHSGGVYPQSSTNRNYGLAVRLVSYSS